MYDEEGNLKREFVIAIPIVVIVLIVTVLFMANLYRGNEEKKLEKVAGSNKEFVVSSDSLTTEEPKEDITVDDAVKQYLESNGEFKKFEKIDKGGAYLYVSTRAGKDSITYDEFFKEGEILDESDTVVFSDLRIVDNTDLSSLCSYYCYNENNIIIVKYEDDYEPYIDTNIDYSVPVEIANTEISTYKGYNIVKCTKRCETHE